MNNNYKITATELAIDVFITEINKAGLLSFLISNQDNKEKYIIDNTEIKNDLIKKGAGLVSYNRISTTELLIQYASFGSETNPAIGFPIGFSKTNYNCRIEYTFHAIAREKTGMLFTENGKNKMFCLFNKKSQLCDCISEYLISSNFFNKTPPSLDNKKGEIISFIDRKITSGAIFNFIEDRYLVSLFNDEQVYWHITYELAHEYHQNSPFLMHDNERYYYVSDFWSKDKQGKKEELLSDVISQSVIKEFFNLVPIEFAVGFFSNNPC
jgi:hypothetical protein